MGNHVSATGIQAWTNLPLIHLILILGEKAIPRLPANFFFCESCSELNDLYNFKERNLSPEFRYFLSYKENPG